MQSLCRICRKDCHRPASSVEISRVHEGVLIHEMLSKTCPIDIDDPITQLFPQRVCHECLEVLTAAYNLQRVSVESDQYFRQTLFSDRLVVKSERSDDLPVKEERVTIFDGEDFASAFDEPEIEMESESETYSPPPPARNTPKRASLKFSPRIAPECAHAGDPYFACDFCQIRLRPRSNMMKHLRHEHDPYMLPYHCSYCPARFKSDHKRELHETIQHDGEEPSVLVCEHCGVNGVSNEGMRSHLREEHGVEEMRSSRFVCAFTPRPCNKATRYEDIVYACNFCDMKLRPRQSLLKHMQRKHDPVLFPFHCNYCAMRFREPDKRALHEATHAIDDERVLVCEVCNATGTRKSGMQQHRIDDHGLRIQEINDDEMEDEERDDEIFHPLELDNSSFQCSFCEERVKPRSRMMRHMRTHNPSLFPYGCKLCILRFETKAELTTHSRIPHNSTSEILTCDMCGVTGDHKAGMATHMSHDHLGITQQSTTGALRCLHCAAKFTNARGLANHMLARHRETTKCEHCSETFSTKRDMSQHVMMVHCKLFRALEPHEITVNLRCVKCEEEQVSFEALMEHTGVHRASFRTEKTKCHFCPRNLKGFAEFVEHAKYHAQPATHECLTCKKKYPFDEKLFSHVKNHKRYDCYKVECKKCTQKFRSAKDLEIHDKVKHNKETLFICPICAKSMSSANGLDQHIRYVHNKEQEKKFQCKSCPMKFILKTKLIRHEAIHSTERPHVCEICGNSFKHSEGLNLHMKRHNGTLERKHACSQCNHRFTTKHRLDQHMMTHTGLKPHECKFCDRAYASKGDLVKHMQKLHVGDAIYQCDKCPRAFRLIVELREHQSEHAVY